MTTCESVRFAKPVADPAQPDSIGRTDFARPSYALSIDAGLVSVEHGGVTYLYPTSALAHAIVARQPAKVVPRGR